MRIARLPFSRMALYTAGGIDKNLFKSMIDLFPVDAKVVGFGSDPSSNVDYIFVESAGFDEVKPGSLMPDGQVFFTKHPDGQVSCDKIEWSDPFKSVPKSTSHVHEWETYTGLSKTETYCKTCGIKQ